MTDSREKALAQKTNRTYAIFCFILTFLTVQAGLCYWSFDFHASPIIIANLILFFIGSLVAGIAFLSAAYG